MRETTTQNDVMAERVHAYEAAMREARRTIADPMMAPGQAQRMAEHEVQRRFEAGMEREMQKAAERVHLNNWRNRGDFITPERLHAMETAVLHRVAIELEADRTSMTYRQRQGVSARV